MNLDLATRRRIVIVLGCLTGMGAVSVDMSLPSIPAMVSDLATSLPVGQQVVGVFMLGIAIGQLPAGLLSDRIGRVPVLMTAISAGIALLRVLGESPEAAREKLRALRRITGEGVGDHRLEWGDEFASRLQTQSEST